VRPQHRADDVHEPRELALALREPGGYVGFPRALGRQREELRIELGAGLEEREHVARRLERLREDEPDLPITSSGRVNPEEKRGST